MARYAVIENGKVTNVVEADASDIESNWVAVPDDTEVGVGTAYDSGTDTWTRGTRKEEDGLDDEGVKETAKAELVDTDWTQLPDVGLTDANVTLWRTYRAELRKVKDGTVTYDNWPTKPTTEYS